MMSIGNEKGEDGIRVLKNKPDESEIIKTLQSVVLEEISLVGQMDLVNTLLNYTVPESYKELGSKAQGLIKRQLATFLGISNLLNRISGLKGNSSREVLQLYIDMLEDALEEGTISRLEKIKRSSTESREIDKLFFRGKMFAILNEVTMGSDLTLNKILFQSTDNYCSFLSREVRILMKETKDYKVTSMYSNSLMSFSSAGIFHFFDRVFDKESWHDFIILTTEGRKLESTNFLRRLYFEYIPSKFLQNSTKESTEIIAALSQLLEFSTPYIDTLFLESVCESSNYKLSDLTACLLVKTDTSNVRSKVEYLLSSWGDQRRLKIEPLVVQENRTRLIIQILSMLEDKDFLLDITKSKSFVGAVSNRLSSFSDTVKLIGIILADKICILSGQTKIFNFDDKEVDASLMDRLTNGNSPQRYSGVQDPWETLWNRDTALKPLSVTSNTTDNVNSLMSKMTVFEMVDKEDSDDEDFAENGATGLNDDSVNTRQKVTKPLYIKNLLEYLTVDTSKPYAYDMRQLALIHGPTLLRQKAKFGSEVSFHSEDLLLNLLQLNNHFEDTDFEELRLSNLIAVLVANSASAPYICRLLLTGDYSLQQRICILTALSLAARELRGIDDDLVKNSYSEKDFASKMLPSNLHNKFLSEGDANYSPMLGRLESSIQDNMMQVASEEANEISSGRKVLRVSQRLRNDTKRQTSTARPTADDFPRVIKSNFFYPLIEVWFQAGQINIGHYTPILISHYIKTLMLILHAAYPLALNFNDMVRDLLSIVIPLTRKIDVDEVPLTESIITGFLLICDVMDDERFIMEFHNEIELIYKWISSFWEDIIDKKSKSLAAALVLKLSSLSDKFAKTLIDRSDGFL